MVDASDLKHQPRVQKKKKNVNRELVNLEKRVKAVTGKKGKRKQTNTQNWRKKKVMIICAIQSR